MRPRRRERKPIVAVPHSGPPGCFVYLLFAELPEGNAGYVGHTINILERMRNHRNGHRDGKSSTALFALARASGVPVRLAILEEMMDRGRSVAIYSQREALWFHRFSDAGWKLPDSHLWGRFRRVVDLDLRRLDLTFVHGNSEPLDDWLGKHAFAPSPKGTIEAAGT